MPDRSPMRFLQCAVVLLIIGATESLVVVMLLHGIEVGSGVRPVAPWDGGGLGSNCANRGLLGRSGSR